MEDVVRGGRPHTGNKQKLGRDLRAVVPGLRLRKLREGDARPTVYTGISLR